MTAPHSSFIIWRVFEAYGTNVAVLFNIFRGNPFSLPVDIRMVERLLYGSQAFFPLERRPFLVIVAEDRWGLQQSQAFLAKAGQGVNYRANVWHHPLLVLDAVSDFVVVDRAGWENNLEEYFYGMAYRIGSLADRYSGGQCMKNRTTRLEELNGVSSEMFCFILSGIFKHSPWVEKRIVSRRPFASAEALYRSMAAEVHRSSKKEKMALIRAHPDLAGKAARHGTLTDESGHEQKGAGLDRLEAEDFSEFQRLNTAYKERFGFLCIITVRDFDRHHDKFSILANMRERLYNIPYDEYQEALR